jgi:lipoprotein-anchoring transpeptidase ErfK/SrfK
VRGVIALVLLIAALAAPAAGAQPAVGQGCDTEQRSLREPALAFGAWAEGPVRIFTEPEGKVRRTFKKINPNGLTTVFGVLSVSRDEGCRPKWYRVQLPMRPNGITGWIRPYAVRVVPLTSRIVVDLSDRRVTLFERGRRVFSATVAIGTSQTPTPTGRYYVNQRLIPADTSGPFGPGALGISAFSEVLTGWTQGGPVAIHGTNRPELLGRAVSNGCIRVRNDHLVRLFRKAYAGTPVTVRA